jgi:hypothetical protein
MALVDVIYWVLVLAVVVLVIAFWRHCVLEDRREKLKRHIERVIRKGDRR